MSLSPNNRVPFGLDVNGLLREVGEVSPGMQCGCVCPACRGPLVAVCGPRRRWHFRHASAGKKPNCHGRESSMHQMGKQVFLGDDMVPAIETLRLPPIHHSRERVLPGGRVFRYSKTVLEAGDYSVQRPVLEQTCYTPARRDRIKPDVLLDAGGISIAVEVCVWNPVSALKRQKLADYDRPVLQICLPRDAGWHKAAVRRLVSEVADRYWVHVPEDAIFNREFDERYDAECRAINAEPQQAVRDQATSTSTTDLVGRRHVQFRWNQVGQQRKLIERYANGRLGDQAPGAAGRRFVSTISGRWVINLPNGQYLGHELDSVDSPIYARHFHGETDEIEDLARDHGGTLMRLSAAIKQVDRTNPSALFAPYFASKRRSRQY